VDASSSNAMYQAARAPYFELRSRMAACFDNATRAYMRGDGRAAKEYAAQVCGAPVCKCRNSGQNAAQERAS